MVIQNVSSLQGQGTVRPITPFDPKTDASRIHDAMKGWWSKSESFIELRSSLAVNLVSGKDKKTLLEIICRRSNDQRLEIAAAYKTMFGKVNMRGLLVEPV